VAGGVIHRAWRRGQRVAVPPLQPAAGRENQDYTGISDVPLQLVFRSAARYSLYQRDDETGAQASRCPRTSSPTTSASACAGRPRTAAPARPRVSSFPSGIRGQFRTDSQEYGYHRDRDIEAQSHLFWSRALVAWEFSNAQRFEVTLTGGVSIHADRFSAYRLGGALPMNANSR
jgi:hypothetical protein